MQHCTQHRLRVWQGMAECISTYIASPNGMIPYMFRCRIMLTFLYTKLSTIELYEICNGNGVVGNAKMSPVINAA